MVTILTALAAEKLLLQSRQFIAESTQIWQQNKAKSLAVNKFVSDFHCLYALWNGSIFFVKPAGTTGFFLFLLGGI